MRQSPFPALPLKAWQPTRDTIHLYSRLLGAVRRALAPPQKHWWHIGLHTAAAGLTTTPIPAGRMTFDILLDFTAHQLTICTSEGDWWDMRLMEHTISGFRDELMGALQTLEIPVDLDGAEFDGKKRLAYEAIAVEDYWQALSQIDSLLKQFKGQLREETSPVLLWPHQFDLSLTWFSGRLASGEGPGGADQPAEQMTFGFSTGDSAVSEPYFYVTAHPRPEALREADLPAGATWYEGSWQGALLPYNHWRRDPQPRQALLDFWGQTQAAGAALMADL